MKIKLSRSKLLKWLKSTTQIALFSISLTNNVSTVITNTSSPQFIAKAMTQNLDAFPKGTYLVKYERVKKDEKHDDIPFSRNVWAMAYNANVTGGGKIIHLSSLLPKLADYEYFITSNNDTGAYQRTSIVVKQPENPMEVESLLDTLNKHASFVSLEDGTGKITGLNYYINGKKFT